MLQVSPGSTARQLVVWPALLLCCPRFQHCSATLAGLALSRCGPSTWAAARRSRIDETFALPAAPRTAATQLVVAAPVSCAVCCQCMMWKLSFVCLWHAQQTWVCSGARQKILQRLICTTHQTARCIAGWCIGRVAAVDLCAFGALPSWLTARLHAWWWAGDSRRRAGDNHW
jgi:hypothetical protein